MADKTIKVTLNAVDNVSAKFKAVSDSATTMGDALEKSGAESAKGMDQLGKSAETNTKAMGSMKAEAAAVGAVLGVLAAGAMKAGEASQNQARQLLVLSRLYGDAASSMDQYANKIQETTRFSNDQAREAEIIFATLHNNYGVAQDDIQRLVSISADLAESYGMSITDAAQRIQSAIRGEAEAAEALGLTMNQQAIDRNNLTLSMSNQEAAQFRLNALWEQTANLQGVAAQRANSAAGEFRQFTNTMQDGVQAVGDFIGPFGQIAAEMAPIALAAPVAGAAVGTLVGRLKESKLAMSALGAVTSPVGLAITGVVAALGVAGYAFLKNKEDAAQAKAAWDAAGASIDALAQKSMEMALAGQTGAAGWAGNIANETKSFFEGMNQELAQLKEDLDHTVDPSTMTGASKAYFEAFLAEAQRNKGMMSEWLTAQITLDPTDSSKMVIDWANTLNTPETQAAIGSSLSDLFSLSSNPYVDQDKLRSETNRIVSEMLTTKDVTGARAELTSLYEELAAGAEKASASAQKLKQDFSFDDLKGQGKLELANDLKAVSSELDNIATGWQKVNVTARTMNALPAEDQAAVLEHNAAAMQMSVELAGQYAEAQERINEKVASGQYDNKQIAADLAAINQQRLVNIATGMDAAKANDLAARAVVELSKGTADYTKVLTDAQQAQVSFTTSGANILDFYNRLQEAMSKTLNVSSSERAVSELAMGLDRTGKSLDSVLTTFSRIDALGSRSSSAASIAESMIGNADELGALPKLMDDIAAGTSRATLSQQDYIQAMGAGRAIIASNVQVQGLLTSIRAKQLPYLAAQQVAYEGNIAALERMNASDQRRVLMLQDTTVQQGLAAAGALQLQSAYTSMTQAQVDQLATQALLNPEVAEALELYKALRVNADGYYAVLTANGQWATSSIKAVTDNVTWQREATEAAAGSWEAWKAEAAAAGLTAEELEKNLEGLKGTLIEVSGLGDSLAGIGMMGLGSESTGLAGNLIQSGAALESAYRVIVSNTEGIKGQFQELYDWGEKLIGEEGVWSRMDDLDALGLLKPGQWREAQDAFNVITQLNEQVANSIDAIQVGLAPVLADAAEKQAAYIEQLRGMGEAQQLATLGWMDSAESARAFELATLAADAAAGKFGDTGMEMANQAILAAANMDPVIAKMLESIGLIKEVDGDYVVQFDAVDNASGTIESLNTSLKIFTLLAMGVPPAVIKAEVQGKGDVDDLYESMLGVPAHKTSSIDVTVNSTGVDEAGNKIQTLTLADGTTVTVLVGASGTDSLIDADSKLKAITLADGTVVTVDVEADTTGWDQLTADELAGQLGDVQINSVLNPPTGWTPDDWNGAEGPFPAIEIDTKAKPLNETPAYTGGAVDVPVTFAGNPTVGDGTGGALAGIAPADQEIIITATLQDNASQGLSSVQSTIDNLPKDTPITVTASTSDAISSINAVTETIALVPKSTEVTVSASTGDAVANINAVIDAMNSVYSKTVVLDVVTQYTTIGTPSGGARGVARHGGIPGYAHGGVLFEGGEAGPELAHFATGGTALLPSHALYLAPPHTYISPNNTGSARRDAPLVNIEQLVVGGNTTPADADEIATMIVNSLDRAIEHRLRGGGLS